MSREKNGSPAGDVPVRCGHATDSDPIWRQAVVTALPVTAALGPYLFPLPLGPVTLFAYRTLVVVAAAVSVVLFARWSWWRVPIARTYALLGGAWLFWAVLNAFRAPALDHAALEVAALGSGFVTGILLLQLRAYSRGSLTALRRGWVLAFLATAAVATWELTTGQHLPSSAVERVGEEALRGITLSTFGNPNNYAAFLLLAAPFLVWSHASSRRRWARVFYAACMLSLPALLFLTASRVALLGLVAELGTLWFLSRRYRGRILVYVGLLGVAGLLAFRLVGVEPRMLMELSALIGGVGEGGSIARRWNLLLSGLWLLAASWGLGVGPGGFVVLLRRGAVPFDTGGLADPHNFWIEVLSQYGLPVFICFVAWITYLAVQVWRKLGRSVADPEELGTRRVAETVLVGLAGYFFAAVANSSYMMQSTNWMFWASILVMAVYLRRSRLLAVTPVRSGTARSAGTHPFTRRDDD